MSISGTNIFVTGGLGFIGSHTVLVLLENGAKVTLIDNLSNSFIRVLDHIKKLAGEKAGNMKFVECDINDYDKLSSIFQAEKFDAVIHFAGFKAVGESVAKPLEYYQNNFQGTITLLRAMRDQGLKNIVFSSSCTVYGLPEKVPITEDCPTEAISPYGRTKLFQEWMFRDIAQSDKEWRILLLRYFNPVAAHPSGELGEHPIGIPNNLMPYIQQVALGQRECLSVFGGDYPTPDGTCIRDYIHVMDLAEGHVAAVAKLLKSSDHGLQAINLGTGHGSSVFEMIRAFEKASGKEVKHKVVDKRAGDTVAVWADTTLAEKELGWKAKYNVQDMCTHQWQWATKFPQGYETA
ncbi:UDP-glucose 4-epimerase [Dunaliella salina]|uniref:UDP-glucose 4-epimerase n=1 Tax=Dunaliella salina TaxID=3046 RepID=A0ABQ7H0F4_DUNSA|nr:UDP-glucose 4-epimerase [Dunaliella salina]|eukprot:KAF5840338.1 UDP-glucose 4-epimerase [Dunaliella salina]